MASVQNIRARDRDVLAGVRNLDLVRIVLARGYRISLARRSYTDYLDHKVTVLILVVSAIGQVAISGVKPRSQVNVAISFPYHPVYCPGSGDARLDDLESVGMIDMAADGRRVAAA